VGYVGTAGTDEIAELKIQSLRGNAVDVSRLVVREGPENQVVIVHVNEETGERVFSGLRTFGEAPLAPSELDREYLTQAEYLHLDGSHFEAALQAAQWMRETGRQVVIDCAKTDGRPAGERIVELVRHVDVLICGSGFGQSLTGYTDLAQAAETMLALGPRIVVQTEGEAGSHTTTVNDSFHTPAFPVKVVDTTGAGDVFHGAYLAGLLRQWDLRSVAWFATGVAALKCTKLGGRRGIPSFEETVAFLQERGIAVPT
jgi:ribokinase